MRRLSLLVLLAALVVACGSGEPAAPRPTPATGTAALLVFATWVPDAKALTGAEPFYRPALTGLTGRDVQTATPAIDASGSEWMVNIEFTAQGKELFKNLTQANVAACPGDPTTTPAAACPGRHLAMWLDLTQADIDHWDDPATAAKVSERFDLNCLARSSAGAACPKLIADALTVDVIYGGSAQLPAGPTRQSATDLANAISPKGSA